MKKEIRKKIRAMSILALLRGFLKGRNDEEIEWIFRKGEGWSDEVTLSFKITLLDTDIVVLQNLSSRKVNDILADAKGLMEKHCKLWDKKWWERLGKQKEKR